MRVVRPILTLTFIALAGSLALYAGQRPKASQTRLTFVRTTKPAKPGAQQNVPEDNQVRTSPAVDANFVKPLISGTTSPARVPARHVPTAAGNPISSASFSGLAGITHKQQRTSDPRANARNFSLEPPDQGLAVGNGFIVEAVNTAVAIYHTTAASSTPGAPKPIRIDSLNDFFGLAPSITQTTPTALTFGPFLSDPRVYFDGATGRFFLTVVEISLDPTTEAFEAPTFELIAVSTSADPTSTWNVFALDVTKDNDSALDSSAPCPCFGDQPLLGADETGFYIDTNVFSLVTGHFGGNQIYAISKSQLEAGTATTATRIHDLTEAEGFAFSLQPAIVPPDGSFDTDNGGTEFFVGSLDFTGTLDNRLAVFALTNTSSIDTTPDLTLSQTIVTTEVYGQPPSAQQKPGPTPLLDFIFQFFHIKNHLELVASNDDRMQQVSFAGGKLWTSLNTVVQTPEGPVRTGGAFFILTPSVSGSDDKTQVGATVFNQGYVAINSPFQDSVEYPAIAVNGAGNAIIGFSVVGQDFFPSAAYATLDADSGAGEIVVSGAGVAPDDGFSGYAPFAFRVGRWGDYGAAAADESGNLWVAGEMIPNAPRTLLANWGTFITKVAP